MEERYEVENLDILNKYFYGGEAEAEAKIRQDIFVEPANLRAILSYRNSAYKVLLGDKGVGKSLLINVLNESILGDESISVVLTPKNFDCEAIHSKKTASDQMMEAYHQIIIAIGSALGKLQTGLLFDTSSINLHNLAVDSGLKQNDLMSKFSSILVAATPHAKDIAKALLDLNKLNVNHNSVSNDIKNVLAKNRRKFWILVDDVD